MHLETETDKVAGEDLDAINLRVVKSLIKSASVRARRRKPT